MPSAGLRIWVVVGGNESTPNLRDFSRSEVYEFQFFTALSHSWHGSDNARKVTKSQLSLKTVSAALQLDRSFLEMIAENKV
jgi:hypothetical protein